MAKYKLGDKVSCRGYIKHSGNFFAITDDSCAKCNHYVNSYIDLYDYIEQECERYAYIDNPFEGIYVGTTTLNTRICVMWEDGQYGKSGWQTNTDYPRDFAVVYYQDNKKHYVPIEWVSAKMDGGNIG